MVARPALAITRARVIGARPDSRRRLEQLLAAATPAATGVPDDALLLVRRLALAAPLCDRPDRAAAVLVEQLRAVRRAPGAGDLYLEHQDDAEILLVAAALAGSRPHPLLMAHLPDAAQPLTRWRRHLLPDTQRLAPLLVRLANAGLTPWLARFEPGELAAALARLLPPAAAPPAGHAAPATPPPATPPPAVTAALNSARRTDPALPAQAHCLLAAALLALHHPHLLSLPATRAALAPNAPAPPPPAAAPGHPYAAAQSPKSIARLNQRTPAALPAIPVATTSNPPPATTAPPAAQPEAAPLPAAFTRHDQTRFSSDHAGLFFLVPAFTAVGLYGDFTQPRTGLAGLSPFALIWWLGRHWRGRAFLADPLAPWLRQAAGLGQREAVTRWFQPPEPVAPRRWLTGQARRLHIRLAQALGSRDPLAILIAQPGEISADGDQLTIRFPLAGHPLALRLAGLDRDPGFLPAAGRAIRFDFPC